MIPGDEVIRRDQETTSSNTAFIRLFYPRGQTATVLAWIDSGPGGAWETATAAASVDNGFTQCVRQGNNYVFPTDRPNAPAGLVLGAGL